MNGKIITSFLLGAIAGGAGTYVYLTKIKKIEYNVIEPVEEEVSPAPTSGEIQNEGIEPADETLIDPSADNDLLQYYKDKGASEETIIDYRKFAAAAEEGTDEDEDAKITVERVDPAKVVKNRDVKFEISEEDAMIRDDYSNAIVAVYDDGAIVDETNGIVVVYKQEEVEEFIGTELIDSFKEDESKETMFVENAMYGTIYEVYKRHEDFHEDYVDEVYENADEE